jgi:hypothetical protein
MVAAHGVESESYHEKGRRERGRAGGLCFGDLDHIASLVFSAMRANTVWELLIMAIRALGQAGGFQRVMGTPRGSAALRVSAFGIWHFSIPSLSV